MTNKVERSNSPLWKSVEMAALGCIFSDNVFMSYSPVRQAEVIIQARDVCREYEEARERVKQHIQTLKNKIYLLEDLLPKEAVDEEALDNDF